MAFEIETHEAMAARQARATKRALRKAALERDVAAGLKPAASAAPAASAHKQRVLQAHPDATAQCWKQVDRRTRIVDARDRVLGTGDTAAQAWAQAAARLGPTTSAAASTKERP